MFADTKRNVTAATCFIFAVLAWSCYPLLLGIAESNYYDVSFIHFILVSMLCVGLATSLLVYKKYLTDKVWWQAAWKTRNLMSSTLPLRMWDRVFIIGMFLATPNIAVALLVARGDSGILASLGYETWILFFVLFRLEKMRLGNVVKFCAVFGVCIISVGVVYWSYQNWGNMSVWYLLLSVFSGFLGAVVIEGTLRWGYAAKKQLPMKQQNMEAETAFCILGSLAVTLVAAIWGGYGLLQKNRLSFTPLPSQ